MFPFIQYQCFDRRRGVFLLDKVSVFFLNKGAFFWPEINALGVFLNFDTERMYHPINRSTYHMAIMTGPFVKSYAY